MVALVVAVVASAMAGTTVGLIGHAFASRWPCPRCPGVGRIPLAAGSAGAAVLLATAGPRGTPVAGAVLLLALLAPIVAIDLDLRLIPDVLTVPGAITCLVFGAVWGQPLATATWMLVGAGVFALPALAVPGSVGWGDVKLAALMGAALGSAVLVALGVGLMLGGLAAAAVVVRLGRSARGRTLPFAPPLAVGCLVALPLL